MAARKPRMTKRADGRYERKVTFDGKRVPFYGRTQEEVNAQIRQAHARHKAGKPVKDSNRALADWLTDWQNVHLAGSDRDDGYKDDIRGYIRKWIIPNLGDIPLAKLRVQDVENLLLIMKEAGRGHDARRNCYNALRMALDNAVANELLAHNVTHRVKRPSPRRKKARWLKPGELAPFLEALKPKWRYGPVVLFILATGVRRGEALGLRWEDVDLDRAEACILASAKRVNGVVARRKTKNEESERTIALSPEAVRLLRGHKAAQAAERLKAGPARQDQDLVFGTATGALIDPRNLLTALQRSAAAAGLRKVGVHTLRHTYAATALSNGVPRDVVANNLGHSGIRMLDIYSHVTDQAAKKAARKVSRKMKLAQHI